MLGYFRSSGYVKKNWVTSYFEKSYVMCNETMLNHPRNVPQVLFEYVLMFKNSWYTISYKWILITKKIKAPDTKVTFTQIGQQYYAIFELIQKSKLEKKISYFFLFQVHSRVFWLQKCRIRFWQHQIPSWLTVKKSPRLLHWKLFMDEFDVGFQTLAQSMFRTKSTGSYIMKEPQKKDRQNVANKKSLKKNKRFFFAPTNEEFSKMPNSILLWWFGFSQKMKIRYSFGMKYFLPYVRFL